MHLAPVTSSQLLRAGYDEDTQTFVCQFSDNAAIYAYLNVDPMLADRFDEAESKGSYFIKEIRGKRGEPLHQYRKLGDASIMDADGNISDDLLAFPAEAKAFTKPQGKPLPPAPDIHKPKPVEGQVMPRTDVVPELPAKDEDLKVRALTVQDQSRALSIASGPQYASAEGWLLTLKRERKMVFDRLDALVAPALEAYRKIQKFRDETVAPYDEAERIIKSTMLRYTREEEERRRSEERRLTTERQEQAKRDAEEASRQEAEQMAQVHEAQGELELAQSVRANPLPMAPVPVAPVVLEREVPKGASSVREKWTYRVVNENAIPMTHQFYTLDPKKLAAYAKMMKSQGTISGALEVFDEGTISARTK